MPFQKGKSGNPAGKRKGTLSRITKAHREWASEFLSSPEYRASAEERILSGKAPHLEAIIVQQITGKPKDVVEINAPRPLVVDLITGPPDDDA